MAETVTIAPTSRLMGRGKVTIHLDEAGEVAESRFHVVEFRGFEKLCEGRMFWEMPVITTRICGICPVSHHLASAKACDDLLRAKIPSAAKKLRELMHMGQFIQSHAFHFLFLAAPDFLLGPASNPAKRNIVGLMENDPELIRRATRLRKIGQGIVERVGGRSTHPVAAMPGGMSKPLSHEDRFVMQKEIDEALELALFALEMGKNIYRQHSAFPSGFATIQTKHLGLVRDGNLELYDGRLRLKDLDGSTLEEFDPKDYLNYIGERVEDWSYMKFPFYKKEGYPQGIYRVAPLARLNVADDISTPLASKELELFKSLGHGKPVQETLYYHYARLIEMVYAVERAKQLLDDDDIVSYEVRVRLDRTAGEGIGVIEAPRGTLIHHYWADEVGRIKKANLIVGTVHNNLAINMSINEVAKEYIKGDRLEEEALNMIEVAIRCYDPCLSCATHALGQMPLTISLRGADGRELSRLQRP
ncbi:MAG: Ni/Fe hydrogenase subunit alpha [Anaerolineae bacterium]